MTIRSKLLAIRNALAKAASKPGSPAHAAKLAAQRAERDQWREDCAEWRRRFIDHALHGGPEPGELRDQPAHGGYPMRGESMYRVEVTHACLEARCQGLIAEDAHLRGMSAELAARADGLWRAIVAAAERMGTFELEILDRATGTVEFKPTAAGDEDFETKYERTIGVP